MTTPFETNQYCSILSEQAEEPLAGSALVTETYLLLEYHGRLGKEALEESDLQDEVKGCLVSALKILPKARLLMVRGPNRPYDAGPLFFLVRTTDRNPTVYRFQLGSYSDLLAFDFLSIQLGEAAWDPFRWLEPLYLICTHGRRDLCCAKFGLPIYNELMDAEGGRVWQSSHVGGHRFAPNLIALPHGLMYGRLGSRTVLDVTAAYQRGEIDLSYLRGRASYPQPAQAAEIYLRQQTGQLGLDAYHLLSAQEVTPGIWQVIFETTRTGKTYHLNIKVEKTLPEVFESCQAEKKTFLTHYLLDRLEEMG